ncbi:hypothetical protein [Nocardia seriolae]|uniref:hypothetical protein n=1 Tax=Nocardia seriolae TaxID=37332 RepID=UPI0004ACFBFC|nr:hypothetical protein [Nocardia seriolae]MTJ61901.1 hypothetical protein [Nocardia seriolae]MTJ76329.1 hypothetical protein [Nocardia seriolae]MTJ90069.1 hypothetical protein [Nocardia seriolae]MTK28836.1 hypothetical protein [Nocardia seriolae]MTK39853.1 hypothetical protein [Nocardia seriolae]
MTTTIAAPARPPAIISRIAAVDAARGLAVLGMITVHVGVPNRIPAQTSRSRARWGSR